MFELINDNCIEWLCKQPDKSVDLILTDPPYGIGLEYNSFTDSQNQLKQLISAFMPEALRVSKRVLLTPGVSNLWLYPQPNWVLNWVCPAGNGRNSWGFTCHCPILAYGKDPYLANGLGSRPDTKVLQCTRDKSIKHPCPKPVAIWQWLLERGSVNKEDIICDPFMGSGTTGICCLSGGWSHFTGIELDPVYFTEARDRIETEQSIQDYEYQLEKLCKQVV